MFPTWQTDDDDGSGDLEGEQSFRCADDASSGGD